MFQPRRPSYTGCHVEARVQFMLCLLVHLTLIGKAPTYITDLLQPVLTLVSLDSLAFGNKVALALGDSRSQ